MLVDQLHLARVLLEQSGQGRLHAAAERAVEVRVLDDRHWCRGRAPDGRAGDVHGGAERRGRLEAHLDLRGAAQAVHQRGAKRIRLLFGDEVPNLGSQLRHVAADAGLVGLDERIDLGVSDRPDLARDLGLLERLD